ncbi:28028_t:CDS:2, partial [Gigaspora margarita]
MTDDSSTVNFQEIQYANKSKNVSFEYIDSREIFQRKKLGLSNSYLLGRLNFGRTITVESIEFFFKGIEQMSHVLKVGKAICNVSGTRILTEKHLIIKFEEPEQIDHYCFKFLLHSNLSSSFHISDKENNASGHVTYTFCVTIHEIAKLFKLKEFVEIYCPLKQILFSDHKRYINVTGTHDVSEMPLLKYSFNVPEYFGLRDNISVPVKVTFTQARIRIVKIQISLKMEPSQILDNKLEQELPLSIQKKLNTSYSEQTVIVANIDDPNDRRDNDTSHQGSISETQDSFLEE